jgi:hypothetical protein
MKRKYDNYHKTLDGFEACQILIDTFKEEIENMQRSRLNFKVKSKQLRQLLNLDGETEGECFKRRRASNRVYGKALVDLTFLCS